MPDEPIPDKPKTGKPKMVLVLVAVILFVSLSGALAFLRFRKSPKVQPKVLSVLHLETFTVNLADEDSRTFLRVGVDIGIVRSLEEKDKKEAAGAEIPVVRDAVLSVLMATRSEELAGSEGKQKLKERLLQSVVQKAPEIGAREIFFTEFLLQR